MKLASPSTAPGSIRAAQALFFANALIWLILGIASLVRLASGQGLTPVIIAVLMFGNAGAMLVSGLGIGTRQRRYFYLALAVLAVNILLTFTDQFGLLDFVTLVIDLALLALLVTSRAHYAAGR
jgi:hypothetical protein